VSLNKIGGTAFDLTIGRQEYNLGNGLVIGNEDFYAGNVFDGVKGVWSSDNFSVSGFYYLTAERNGVGITADPVTGDLVFTPAGGSNDQHLLGAVGSFKIGKEASSNLDAYLIRFWDGFEDATSVPVTLP